MVLPASRKEAQQKSALKHARSGLKDKQGNDVEPFVTAILTNQQLSANVKFENLYKITYDAVNKGNAEAIYRNVDFTIQQHVLAMRKQMHLNLSDYCLIFKEFIKALDTLKSAMFYLELNFIQPQNLASIDTIGKIYFKSLILSPN